MRRIIPSITSHTREGHTWRHKIAEIEPLQLRSVGLFVTGLSELDRYECFCELEYLKSHHNFTIPFVHAVSTMKDAEFRFLVETFNTEWFNLHPTWEYPLRHPLSEYVRSKILIENSNFDVSLRGEDLSEFAGLCIDLSHLEDSRRTCQHVFNETLRLCGAYSVLANHISAVATSPTEIRNGLAAFSSHHSNRPEEFNYLHGMAAATIAPLCALELENSLAEQVSLIPFIQSVIAEHRAQRRSVA